MMSQIARESGKNGILSKREVRVSSKHPWVRDLMNSRRRDQTRSAMKRVRQNSRALIEYERWLMDDPNDGQPLDSIAREKAKQVKAYHKTYYMVRRFHREFSDAIDEYSTALMDAQEAGFRVKDDPYRNGVWVEPLSGLGGEWAFWPRPTEQDACWCEDCNARFWRDHLDAEATLREQIEQRLASAVSLWRR